MSEDSGQRYAPAAGGSAERDRGTGEAGGAHPRPAGLDRAAEQATAAQVRALAMADVHATDGHDPRPAVLTATEYPAWVRYCNLPQCVLTGPHKHGWTDEEWDATHGSNDDPCATPLEAADCEADYIREQFADAAAEYDRERL